MRGAHRVHAHMTGMPPSRTRRDDPAVANVPRLQTGAIESPLDEIDAEKFKVPQKTYFNNYSERDGMRGDDRDGVSSRGH